MHVTESDPQHFLRCTGYDKSIFKIIFATADLSTNTTLSGKQIIKKTHTIMPIFEVWLDESANRVIDIKDPPAHFRYQNVPVPVF